MDNVRKVLTYILVMLAVAAMSVPAGAGLVPAWIGAPAIVQSGTASAFNQDTACVTDFENINIKFPAYFDCVHLGIVDGTDIGSGLGEDAGVGVAAAVTSNVLPFGPVNLAFPDIQQTVIQARQVSHTDFAQTNELAAFTYPFAAAGPIRLPGFDFGF